MKHKIILTSIICLIISGLVKAQQQTETLNIFFDINKSAVDNNNAKSLDKLISDKNVSSITIYGYTDFLGSVEYNQQLSEKRSSNVRNYLISKGINIEKITQSKGEGIHPGSEEQSRQDFSDRGIQAHRMVKVAYTVAYSSDDSKSSDESVKLSDENVVAGNKIVLENIIFYVNSDKFIPQSYPTLRELLETMQKFPTLKIEIQGHICCSPVDTDEYTGKPLSISRAEAVYNYLVRNGIDSNRMTYSGFGSTRRRFPLERNTYEEDMNRRVEILVLER